MGAAKIATIPATITLNSVDFQGSVGGLNHMSFGWFSRFNDTGISIK